MKGYPCQELLIRIKALVEHDEYKEVLVRRHLMQLGFGDRVEPTGRGEHVTIPKCMTKIVLKMPLFCGWLPESLKGGTIMNLLKQHVSEHTIEGLQIRL